MSNNITAIILAGGKSSRMGTDKGLMDYRGVPMVQHIIQVAKNIFNKVVIVSNNDAYSQFGLPVIGDVWKGIGPLGGIYSGLKYSETEWNFFIACDMPGITEGVIKFLTEQVNGNEAVIPRHHHQAEPLCALYNKSQITIFERCVAEKEFKMMNVYKKLNHKLIEMPDVFFTGTNPFKNINSASDLT